LRDRENVPPYAHSKGRPLPKGTLRPKVNAQASMQLAVIGANGQLGSEVVRAAKDADLNVLCLEHAQCEVTSDASVTAALEALKDGDVVVNTAAFHRTDECEVAPHQALAVNALGAYRVARVAAQRGAVVVYISTDFVFDGEKQAPYTEDDAPRPLNTYGITKHAGELLVQAANPCHYIVRIASVFGATAPRAKGRNFVDAMLTKARRRESPTVVNNLVMSPTYAPDAAVLMVDLLRRSAPFGIYHLTNAGACSWYDFANAIFRLSGSPIRAQAATWHHEDGKARRPRYSALTSLKLGPLGLAARPWEEALAEYIASKLA